MTFRVRDLRGVERPYGELSPREALEEAIASGILLRHPPNHIPGAAIQRMGEGLRARLRELRSEDVAYVRREIL